jgi:hypothetical protein
MALFASPEWAEDLKAAVNADKEMPRAGKGAETCRSGRI